MKFDKKAYSPWVIAIAMLIGLGIIGVIIWTIFAIVLWFIYAWAIIWGLFWTAVFAGGFGYLAYRVMEFIRLDKSRRRPFHQAWTTTAVILVFLPIWNFGYNLTMFDWEIKPIEQAFRDHADHDGYIIRNQQMDYGGSLDSILAQRDAVLKKRHMIMHGDWHVSTTSGSHVDSYYDYDPFWWWPWSSTDN